MYATSIFSLEKGLGFYTFVFHGKTHDPQSTKEGILVLLLPIMRYEYWDVILFPAESHIPIQEFRTACYVSQGQGQSIHILQVI